MFLNASHFPFNSRPHKEVDVRDCHVYAFSLIFQFTTSQGGRLRRRYKTMNRWPFNSRPHKEVDPIPDGRYNQSDLSIHDLTRRSTRGGHKDGEYRITFQFTTSQGGRPGILSSSIHQRTFNSRPHKEVDLVLRPRTTYRRLSIHDLTRRSTM